MNEQEELRRLREVAKAAKAVLDVEMPLDNFYTCVPIDRLNWLRETMQQTTSGEHDG